VNGRPLNPSLLRQQSPDAGGKPGTFEGPSQNGVQVEAEGGRQNDWHDKMLPADWPNRECSREVDASGLHWHVQRKGSGPSLLLIHGTGASTHSWGGLLPLLAKHYDVLAPDLPGHGFSSPFKTRPPTLPNMADALGDLLKAEHFEPELIVGHSAGAAIALQMTFTGGLTPGLLVGLNAALFPYGGWLAPLAQPLARAFTALAPVPRILAARARQPGTVERLIAKTGSRLDPAGIETYRNILERENHVAATLSMMANWDLNPLLKLLPELATPLCLVVGEGDRTVPPGQAAKVLERVPAGRIIRLGGLGHLAHEEKPRLIEDAIEQAQAWRHGL